MATTTSATLFLSAALLMASPLRADTSPPAAPTPPTPTGDGNIDDVDLLSSVMWQPLADGTNYIYPPGIPGVLTPSDNRSFRIEQYYNMKVDADTLMPHVLGTWPHDDAHDLVWDPATSTWLNQFVTITKPVCDATGGDYGYRCTVDLRFGADTPTGTIGISVGMVVDGIEFTHPNSIFWVILPEQSTPAPGPTPTERAVTVRPLAAAATLPIAAAAKQVVEITLAGNFSLGSGFLTRTIEPLAKLFKPQVMQIAAAISDPKIFVVTAAHLFPVGYTYGSMMDPLADGVADAESQPFRLGYVYDLTVNGQLLPAAALLLARNAESDVALLQIRKSVVGALASALGVATANDIKGLDFAASIDTSGATDPTEVVLGYPAELAGQLVQRHGSLARAEYPTDDTSNFGPLGKLKLVAGPTDGTLAEPGMSGGPVLDATGKVIGLTIERPNDTNSLIALDLTSINQITDGYALDEKKCMLRFSPFDRILTLVHRDPSCDYGHFGSPQNFAALDGEWTIQEILGFADGTGLTGGDEPTNGHTIINGHAIINGHVIINGVLTIKSSVLIVNQDNLDDINTNQLSSGFKLNADSFRSFVPKGVRILDHTGPAAPSPTQVPPLGDLILGTRQSLTDRSYSPVYSIRDFTIWLHKNVGQANYSQLLCVHADCSL